jgi:Tfp pilus assembly protein FimT
MKQLYYKQGGITFFELCLTLVVMALICQIVIKLPQHFYSHTRINQQRLSLLNDIQFTQAMSIALHMPVILCGAENRQQCHNQWSALRLIFVKNNSRPSQISHADLLSVTQMHDPDGQLFWRSFPRQSLLQFMPNGKTAGINGMFWYCSTGAKIASWALSINQSGQCKTADVASVKCPT